MHIWTFFGILNLFYGVELFLEQMNRTIIPPSSSHKNFDISKNEKKISMDFAIFSAPKYCWEGETKLSKSAEREKSEPIYLIEISVTFSCGRAVWWMSFSHAPCWKRFKQLSFCSGVCSLPLRIKKLRHQHYGFNTHFYIQFVRFRKFKSSPNTNENVKQLEHSPHIFGAILPNVCWWCAAVASRYSERLCVEKSLSKIWIRLQLNCEMLLSYHH